MARKFLLCAAAAAIALGAAAPAYAGGGHRHHHRHHHHHGGGGGKAAAIALGVVGGAIILNELAEDRARDRYYDDRYRAGRAYDDGYADGRYDARRYSETYDDYGYEDDGYYDDGLRDGFDDGGELLGGPADPAYAPPPRVSEAPRYASSPSFAYQACLDHARRALGERGFVVAAPYQPDTADNLGGAWRLTATVRARRGGESWSRAMSCEADGARVYRLELI